MKASFTSDGHVICEPESVAEEIVFRALHGARFEAESYGTGDLRACLRLKLDEGSRCRLSLDVPYGGEDDGQ